MKSNVFELRQAAYAHQPGHNIFESISFDITAGESVAVLGANGSGKSTLLKILCGLLHPQAGSLKVFGETISEELLEDDAFSQRFHRRVGFIFQSSDVQLFNNRVEDEIAFGPSQLGLPEREVRRRTADMLKMLDIEHLKERPPYRLSGGEKRKVALAAVLILNPEALILDEPGAGLDPKTQRWLTHLLLELNRRGRTIVLSTHNLEMAHTVTRRSLVLSEDHRLVFDGATPQVLSDRALLSQVNLIDEFTHEHDEKSHIHLYTHG